MKFRKRYIRYLPLSILAFLLLVSFLALARPWRPALLPDGGRNFGCSTCHFNPAGGGPRNPFGQDYEAIGIPAGDIYTAELGEMDSDGDGFTNDEEFSAATRPGDATSHPVTFFTITATAGEHGSISPSGEVPVDSGASQKFTITPDEGYLIGDVLVDGNPVPQVIENITPQDAFALIRENEGDPNFVILDVRTPEEFSVEHIENAINIDFFSATFREDVDKLSKMKTYVIYCRSGARSGQALTIMAELNFAEVYNILDGILGWKAAGLPTTTDVTDIHVDMAGHYTFVNVTADHTIEAIFTGIAVPVPNIGIKGDVNNDGEVRSSDAILTLRIAVGLLEPTEYQKWAADVREDGKIGSDDAILILRKAAGLAAPGNAM